MDIVQVLDWPLLVIFYCFLEFLSLANRRETMLINRIYMYVEKCEK